MCDVRIVGKCGRCGGPSCGAVAAPTAGLRTLPVLPDTGHTTWKDRARR